MSSDLSPTNEFEHVLERTSWVMLIQDLSIGVLFSSSFWQMRTPSMASLVQWSAPTQRGDVLVDGGSADDDERASPARCVVAPEERDGVPHGVERQGQQPRHADDVGLGAAGRLRGSPRRHVDPQILHGEAEGPERQGGHVLAQVVDVARHRAQQHPARCLRPGEACSPNRAAPRPSPRGRSRPP